MARFVIAALATAAASGATRDRQMPACDGRGGDSGGAGGLVALCPGRLRRPGAEHVLLQRSAAHAKPLEPVTGPNAEVWWRSWGEDADSAADALAKNMTWEEKTRLVIGYGDGWVGFDTRPGFFVGTVLGVPRLGVPPIKAHDAAQGFRTFEKDVVGTVTSWPSGLAIASAWDPALTFRYAAAIGKEFRAKGANAILGPSLDVSRVMRAGRNVESLVGEDPALGAAQAKAYIKGMQGQGVACVAKHFILNTQETNRQVHSNTVSKRARWEVHYAPFQAAIEADVAAVMCAYNSVDGVPSCENEELLEGDLKQRMGFSGWVMSDWWAVKDLRAAAKQGLDQIMPGSMAAWSEGLLRDAVGEAGVTAMVKRVLHGMISSTAFDHPNCIAGLDSDCAQHMYDDLTSAANTNLAREFAAASVVLLKNEAGTLPLSNSSRIALLGSACHAWHVTDPKELVWNKGDYYVVGGSGRVLSPSTSSIREALEARGAHLTGSYSDSTDEAMAVLRSGDADVAIACGAVTSGESVDRGTLRLDHHGFLVDLAARNARETKMPLVVLTMSSGAILTDFAKHAAAVASVFLAGQETGNAFADVLFGDVAPSGRLPVTFPAHDGDGQAVCFDLACTLTDELAVGWRGLIGQPVAYPFGHGLSYTNFSFTWAQKPEFKESTGEFRLSVLVENTGMVAGAEVAQLYLQFPASAGEPERVLRGFQKTAVLQPGGSETLSFVLSRQDLSIWQDCESESDGDVQSSGAGEASESESDGDVHAGDGAEASQSESDCDAQACEGPRCYSCRDRLEWLMSTRGGSWSRGKAAEKLRKDFPDACGPCMTSMEAAEATIDYVGCFADKIEDRDLPVTKGWGYFDDCAARCKRYKYFGRQYMQECWCGDSYGKHGEAAGCDCDSPQNIGDDANCIYKTAEPAALLGTGARKNQGAGSSAVCTEGWLLVKGRFSVFLGTSSREDRLKAEFDVLDF